MYGAGILIVVLDGVALGAVLFTVAAGLGLSYGAGGVLNLAHGTFWLAGAYLGAALIHETWTGLGLATVSALAACAISGYLLAVLLLSTSRILLQAVMSAGIALAGGWALTEIFGSQPVSVDPPAWLAESTHLAGRAFPRYRLILIVVGVAVAVMLAWFLTRTRAGIRVKAAAGHTEALETLGVNSRKVRAWAVAVGCAMAGLAGVLGGPLLAPALGADQLILVLSLVMVVTAGTRSVSGMVVASLVVGQIQTTALVVLPDIAFVLPYIVLIAALSLRGVRYQVRRADRA